MEGEEVAGQTSRQAAKSKQLAQATRRASDSAFGQGEAHLQQAYLPEEEQNHEKLAGRCQEGENVELLGGRRRRGRDRQHAGRGFGEAQHAQQHGAFAAGGSAESLRQPESPRAGDSAQGQGAESHHSSTVGGLLRQDHGSRAQPHLQGQASEEASGAIVAQARDAQGGTGDTAMKRLIYLFVSRWQSSCSLFLDILYIIYAHPHTLFDSLKTN